MARRHVDLDGVPENLRPISGGWSGRERGRSHDFLGDRQELREVAWVARLEGGDQDVVPCRCN